MLPTTNHQSKAFLIVLFTQKLHKSPLRKKTVWSESRWIHQTVLSSQVRITISRRCRAGKSYLT